MRKILLPVLFVLVMFQACQKEPIPIIPDDDEKVYIPSERVEGRVALAYVTYWGTATPDPRLFTHISYAFAELYVKNGVYEGFKLQGKEARFRQIVNLKQQFPSLKILISCSLLPSIICFLRISVPASLSNLPSRKNSSFLG